jgi:hypothetical protein
MVIDGEKGSSTVQKALTQLDLYHHSLRLVGEEMVLQVSGDSSSNPLDELHKRSVGLIDEGHKQLVELADYLRPEDLDVWQTALNRIGLAARRLARANRQTLIVLNTWRAIEAADEFLSAVSPHYGHERPGTGAGLEVVEEEEDEAATLERLFAEYEDTMAAMASVGTRPGPPFEVGVLRWRGSQLFWVERVEDGVRWVELDPDHELRRVAQERGGVEVAEAKTIEGYPITLLLDTEIAESEVDAYIREQKGVEYFVSGYQVASEQRHKRGGQVKRR